MKQRKQRTNIFKLLLFLLSGSHFLHYNLWKMLFLSALKFTTTQQRNYKTTFFERYFIYFSRIIQKNTNFKKLKCVVVVVVTTQNKNKATSLHLTSKIFIRCLSQKNLDRTSKQHWFGLYIKSYEFILFMISLDYFEV